MTTDAPHLAHCHRYDTSGVMPLPGKGSSAGGSGHPYGFLHYKSDFDII